MRLSRDEYLKGNVMKAKFVILIADSKDVFDLMRPALEKELRSTQFIHCSTQQQAMDFVHSEQRANLIFADWSLTGFTFVDEVRSDVENHNTPVIIMSEDVTKKQIVLNEIENKSTYFLSKPFLDKGLVKKLNKVLAQRERRRSTRIHPSKDYAVEFDIKDKGSFQSELVDISISACLLRLPVEVTGPTGIYDECLLDINIDEFSVKIMAELVRIGHDELKPGDKTSVLVVMKFIDTQLEHVTKLQLMIDELDLRW